jgi:Arc/MetJ-type ribon-helix-helix transcriptional regulator
MAVTFSNPDQERFIHEQVKVGAFPSAQAVVEAAIARMMQESEDSLSDEDMEAIAEAEAEYERGEYEEFSVVAARLRAKFGKQ